MSAIDRSSIEFQEINWVDGNPPSLNAANLKTHDSAIAKHEREILDLDRGKADIGATLAVSFDLLSNGTLIMYNKDGAEVGRCNMSAVIEQMALVVPIDPSITPSTNGSLWFTT